MAPEWIISFLPAVSPARGPDIAVHCSGNTIKTVALPAHGNDFYLFLQLSRADGVHAVY
jgi:hypothetical protein